MNKLLIALTVLASFNAASDSSLDICSHYGEYAKTAAESKYSGVPLSDVMKVANDNKSAQYIVMQAYELPDWSSKDNQAKEVTKFRNKIEMLCFKNQK